jgi:hypothetical protein
MSNLRIIGFIVGVVGLIATFIIYRGPKWKRLNFAFFSLFNLFLIIITLNPDSANFLRDLLSLQQYQYGRLIALLIISNIFLMFLSFYTLSKMETFRFQFDKLVRNLGVEYLEKAAEFKDKIKPIMIVIPAYNEADNLNHLLPRIPTRIKHLDVGVLVVDDGSDDDTKKVTSEHGYIIVSNAINRGGGAALRLGYDILKKAKGHICITMDADGQHQPEEIEKLVIPILNDQSDIVIGSRILGKREQDSFFRITGVYMFSWLISLLLGKKITDPSSGFRAFKMDAVNSIHLSEDQYHTSELIIEAVKKGIRIMEVPITILKRKYGRSKKGRDWVYGFHFAKTIVKTWWR